ncbi:MAG: hypothetical protein ACI87W_001483, partial [Halieaceae bacterium]
STPVFGPIKEQGRAAEKVQGDYGGDWYDLKDAVRMTIVAPTPSSLKQVQSLIRAQCVPRNGFSLLKDSEDFAERSACGYSGLNFVISMSNGPPAEIQANIPGVMYGQMSEKLFRETIGAAKFSEIKGRYRLDGGLGHRLYEIYRVAPGSANAKQVALLSKSYFNCLRGVPNPVAYQALQRDLSGFVKPTHRSFATKRADRSLDPLVYPGRPSGRGRPSSGPYRTPNSRYAVAHASAHSPIPSLGRPAGAPGPVCVSTGPYRSTLGVHSRVFLPPWRCSHHDLVQS